MSFTDILSISAQLILCLSILVTLHECGHFFPAKWFKTRVEKFYLFFDPYFSLWKKKVGETEYGIGWIPFGGYVKIAGMIDESMDKEQMKGEPQPWEFRSKKAWQRLIIMIGGVTVNFLLGFLIFAMILFVYGKSYFNTDDIKDGIYVEELGTQLGLQEGDLVYKIGDKDLKQFRSGLVTKEIILNDAKTMTVKRDGKMIELPVPADAASILTSAEYKNTPLFYARVPAVIDTILDGTLAAKMGVKKNDYLLAIDELPATYYHDYRKAITAKKGQNVTMTFLRGRDTIAMPAQLDSTATFGAYFKNDTKTFPVYKEKYGFLESLPAGVNMGVSFLKDQISAFSQMFTGKISAKDNLGSVFSIATLFDPSWNWEKFWRVTAMLSIILAFFNILPIPALDGGYVMFLLWEMITGKKPNDKFMEYVTIGGFIILITLMIFALGFDINRLLGNIF